MADILIRMEMPKDGRKHTALLQFLEDGKCRGIVEYSKSYDDRSVKVFEVATLPEGHGRLIDADALREDWLENGENEHVYDTNAMLYSIDNSPTIVPAEGGTENGN